MLWMRTDPGDMNTVGRMNFMIILQSFKMMVKLSDEIKIVAGWLDICK